MSGRILVASHDGVYVIVFEGDVRLTLCTTVDEYLEKMFQDSGFRSVIVDLSGTDIPYALKLTVMNPETWGIRPYQL